MTMMERLLLPEKGRDVMDMGDWDQGSPIRWVVLVRGEFESAIR